MSINKVYSHCLDNNDKEDRERRLKWMKEKYPDDYERIIIGNHKADKLAKEGRAKEGYPLPKYLPQRKTPNTSARA